MGFSRQESWSMLPFPSPGDLSDPGIEPRSPALQADTWTSEPPGSPKCHLAQFMYYVNWGRGWEKAMDYSLPGFSVHGILQATILEWVAIPFSRDQTQVSYITGRFLTVGAIREAPKGHLLTPSYWWVEIWLHHKNAGGHKPSADKITCPLMCYVSSKTTIQGFPCLWSSLLP